MDFHHQLKGAILDAVDDGLIENAPTSKIVIKGKEPCVKKDKISKSIWVAHSYYWFKNMSSD